MGDEGDFAAGGGGSFSAHSSRDKAFEIFVKRTITSIQKEAWGRSKEVKEIREACQAFLNSLDQTGCTEETLKQVLYPLQLACASNMQKVVELALACLHKLVAHAWLHGESTAAGTMDILSAHGSLDDDDTVANVIKMVIKCGESTNEALQLAVVRALLTFTTAEHFIAHGECLLSAVRAVFNLALGAENPINKRTASNALLQMLNTICKRVTQIQPRLTSGSSECSSRTVSEALDIYYNVHGAGFHSHNSPHSAKGSGTQLDHMAGVLSPQVPAAGMQGQLQYQLSDAGGPALYNPDALTTTAGDAELPVSVGASNGARVSTSSTASTAAAAAAVARAAQLAQLAEKKDLQGLEAALEAAAAAAEEADDGEDDETAEMRTSATAAVVSAGLQSLNASAASGSSSAGGAPAAADASAGGAGVNGTSAQLQAAGMGVPPQQLQAQLSVGPVPGGSLYSQQSWQQQQQPYQHGRLSGAHSYAGRPGRHAHRLTTQEKDVLLVLTAFCKLASREVPGGVAGSDSVLAQGKLLALEMLAKVLSNPMHNWDHVPESFCRQLRQPLCMALLRNCATPDAAAYGLALKLLMAILNLPRIRLGLRAELGAFYPLLVLRYLEQLQAYLASTSAAAQQQQQQQVQPPDPGNVSAALSALHSLLADPQLLVDLYVNFDCDLQAANLFERTVQVLSGLAGMSDSELEAGRGDKRSQEALAGYVAVRKEALGCCLQVITALESWAKPIKDAALRAIESNQATPGGSQGGSGLGFLQRDSASSLTPGGGSASSLSEAERLAAAKSTKELLAKGITLFNTKGPLKGIESLISNGLLESNPAAVAGFLRTQQDSLDKAQVGELLGHHEDFAVAVMHDWVDSEPSMAGQAIDQSLRRLLGGFRLPGEAQKIDRIMEKFAERYCKDNPSRFHNADSAYLLSFSIIMLNTDAHNPLAERRLTKADFVSMNHAPSSEEGGMLPVLPVQQLEEIYDRVVRDEILVLGESRNNNFSTSRTTNRNRLAAAMGWTTVLQPFKVLAGGNNNKSGAGKDAHAQRRYLQELAEREVVRAAASGNMWYCASHPEHVRPMLQVGFPVLLPALSAAFTSAPDAATAARMLAGLLQLTKLCGLLGLDRQCEAAVGVLAARSGVFDPAAPGTLTEAKQLSALQSLLSLTSGPEAGFLGSSWVIILRAISALDALKHELTRPPPVPVAPTTKEPPANASNPFSRMFQSMFGSSGGRDPNSPTSSAGGALRGNVDPGHAATAVAGAQGAAAAASLGGVRDSSDGGQKTALAVRDAPGAGLVLWAESAAGAMELERPYTYSTSLDGDAVVVFMRALCAVSQEELEAGSSSTAASAAAVGGSVGASGGAAAGRGGSGAGGAGGGPRLYSLQKVVECAYHNMDRIRLVWGKLWAVIAAQLVGASCHPNRRIALYAVDSLRQLVGKLLARAELEHFTHQEEALRPFVAVLRQCDEACVRELAVQCVMQAVKSHAGGLGSGWRMVILALRLGAADGSPPVMAQTQEALQVVVETLYASSPPGSSADSGSHSNSHTFLRETVQAIVAGIRSPAHLELSISAVQLLGGCGARLAVFEDAGGKEEAPAAAVAAAPGGVDLDGDYGWGLLLRTLADVLQHDRRPAVVDASLEMVFGLLASYSARWDAAAWRVLTQRVVRHMLSLPPGLSPPAPQAALDSLSSRPLGKQPANLGEGSAGSSNATATSRLAVASGTGFGSPVGDSGSGGSTAVSSLSGGQVLPAAAFSSVLSQLGGGGVGGGGAGGAVQVGMSVAEQGLLMTTMLKRMDRYYPLLCDQAAHIRAEYRTEMVQQLVAIGVAWYQQNSVYLSTAGIKALMRLAHTFAAGSTAQGSWQLFVGPITTAVQADVQQILALATKQLAEQSAAAAGAADATTAFRSSVESQTGSPRSRSAAASATQTVGAPSPLGAGSAAAAAAKGGIAARQVAAAAAAAAAVAAHLRVRARQLVLLQRGLAAIHRDCRASMSWEEQMQLLDALGLGVDAAIAFNTDLSVAQQQRQQQLLLQAANLKTQQQQQQQQQQGLQAVPEGRSVPAAVGQGLLHDSISLASAVGPDGMHSSTPSGARTGEPLLPFGSSIRFSELSLSQKSSAGGSAAGSAGVSSAGGSLAGAAGTAVAPGSDGGAADAFFNMRSASGGNSGGGGALLLSRSTSAGSSDAAAAAAHGLTGSHSGGGAAPSSSSSLGGDAAAAVAASGGGSGSGDAAGSVASLGFGSVGGAVNEAGVELPGQAAPSTAAQQQQQPGVQQKPGSPEITPLSPTSPSPQPPPQQQQLARQPDPERPNLPPVRTSHPGQHAESAITNAGSNTPGGGSTRGSNSPGSSPLRQRWSGGGGGGSPGRTRMGGLVLPQLVVSSAESVEVVQPALMRLEAEGGLLLIEALTVSLESAPSPSPATQAVRQRLLQLVRCIIQSEAASSSVAPYSYSSHSRCKAVGADGETFRAWDSTSNTRALGSKSLDNPLQDALAGVGWEHAARAPLVVAALQVLSELQGEEYSSEVLTLFPSLCRLMCSSHQLIRQGLAKVFGSGEFLGLLPAAAGTAAAAAWVGVLQQESQQQWQQVAL